ncbi:MAG: response regulator transcription factor [Acidobacteriota bacterium]|nr:response regulator transcription factor [Acidobacteriota bacterium]MDD8039932.1 response regulator transcription factor [Acidobacteriota bacterium]HNT33038.1 response regulator transcription factor [Candidatus Aminicenantes bacterium]
MKKKILLIEDDDALRETTAAFLEGEDFRVETAADGKVGLERALKGAADLIVLDLILPSISGLEICRKLRENGVASPLIMITGRKKDEIDEITGLETGADDYMLKPFGQRELLARIHAILRRARPSPAKLETGSFGDVVIEFKKRTAFKGKKELYLTAKEYDILHYLIVHEGEVVSRNALLNEVWGYEKFPTTRTIDTFIHNLRKKIEKDPSRPVHIITVPWSGYKLKK